MRKTEINFAQTQFLFANPFQDEKAKSQDLIRLYPYGLSVATEYSRPVLLLKDEKGENTLPVFLSPIEAGVTISQTNRSQAEASPHKFTSELLKKMGIEVVRCLFQEIRGHHQFVRFELKGAQGFDQIVIRADEAMSLCVHLNVPIYASHEFISNSRIMNAEMEGVHKGIVVNPKIVDKNHPFVM